MDNAFAVTYPAEFFPVFGTRTFDQSVADGRNNLKKCLAAADDWLNESESDESAHKSRRWLSQPPTEKQLALLPPAYRQDFDVTRYQASALLTFHFNKHAIRALVRDACADALARAA